MNKIQTDVNKVFVDNFGYTPFKERMTDIQNQYLRLLKWTDVKNIKENSGNLLSSLIQLCTESDWDIEDVINNTLQTINGRSEQYKTLGRKINVAILGGAFNPIHNGHIQLAQFVLDSTNTFDEVWLMPAYNHMYNKDMVDSEKRLEMCKIACKIDHRIKTFDFEIKHKLRGETYYFIKKLKEEKKLLDKYNFALIIGLDNANSFDKWVNYEELEKVAQFIVVPRKGIKRDYDVDWYLQKPHIFINSETPILDISSTEIRNMIKENNNNIFNFLDNNIFNYIKTNNLYL